MKTMKTVYIWVDDLRKMPANYDILYRSVWDFISDFDKLEKTNNYVIDLDHDAGEYGRFGGDYYNILKWMEYHYEMNDNDFVRKSVTFRFHTANPVGKENMKNICDRYGWKTE